MAGPETTAPGLVMFSPVFWLAALALFLLLSEQIVCCRLDQATDRDDRRKEYQRSFTQALDEVPSKFIQNFTTTAHRPAPSRVEYSAGFLKHML